MHDDNVIKVATEGFEEWFHKYYQKHYEHWKKCVAAEGDSRNTCNSF